MYPFNIIDTLWRHPSLRSLSRTWPLSRTSLSRTSCRAARLDQWPENIVAAVDENDEEVKPATVAVHKTVVTEGMDLFTELEDRYSSWFRLVRVLAHITRFVNAIKQKVEAKRVGRDVKLDDCVEPLKFADVMEAEKQVLRLAQRKYMPSEVDALTRIPTSANRKKPEERQARREVKRVSSLAKLDPFINKDGLICVGGRLRNSEEEACPVIVPKNTNTALLLIREAHQKVAHCGRCITLNKLRDNGYWIVGAHSAVRRYIDKCRTCRELRGKITEQKMADLPEERVNPSPPFTHCGCDMFGPFLVKEGRKEVKRYGCLFTCLSSRAVHIEVTTDLSADTFIQALRRFIGRRGKVSSIRSDNGTNFVGAENELRKCLEEMDDDKIRDALLGEGCDWISWKKNPPSASHMGGVWERHIRSIRSILTALMKEHSAILTTESLETLLVETESIINSRPLTVD